MLSDKQNTYRCLHTNTTDTVVLEKQAIDQDTISTKPTNATGNCTKKDISNDKTDHAPPDRTLLII